MFLQIITLKGISRSGHNLRNI